MIFSSLSSLVCSSEFLACTVSCFCFSNSSNRNAISLSSIIPHVVHRVLAKGFLLLHRGHSISFVKPASFWVVFILCSSSIASSRSRAEKCTYRLVILLPYVQPANCSSLHSVKTLAMAVRDVWR